MTMIKSILSVLLCSSCTISVVQSYWADEAQARLSVAKVALKITVLIQSVDQPEHFGSGVIIGRFGNHYTVLTAFHVVDRSDRYTLRTPDGIDYPLKNIQRLPNIDMATVQFESDRINAVAKLGNSDAISLATPVYVAGFPKPGLKPGLNIGPIFTTSTGEISAIIPTAQAKEGYAIGYNAATRRGMGGGPVLNDAGEVIAIHGRKEAVRGGTWMNFGVPIHFYCNHVFKDLTCKYQKINSSNSYQGKLLNNNLWGAMYQTLRTPLYATAPLRTANKKAQDILNPIFTNNLYTIF
jgi:S1-C subfamily serine protease